MTTDWTDIVGYTALMIAIVSFSILVLAGAYAIIKETNNPIDYKTYQINSNAPTLTVKKI